MYEAGRHPLDDGSNHLGVFCDSDYAADETKRSTMGIVIMMNGGPIAWSSVLGKTVATSTCEAEVNAAVSGVKDAVHLQRMLFDLGLAPENKTIIVHEDNSAAISQAKAGLRAIRNAKHYHVKLAWLQQLVNDKHVKFQYCPTNDMLADFYTKPLDVDKFIQFRDAIMGVQL